MNFDQTEIASIIELLAASSQHADTLLTQNNMAGIDKIYGNKQQYNILRDWLSKRKPYYLRYLSMPEDWADISGDTEYIISNFPRIADRWLYVKCPLAFVKTRLNEQYGNARPKSERWYNEKYRHCRITRRPY